MINNLQRQCVRCRFAPHMIVRGLVVNNFVKSDPYTDGLIKLRQGARSQLSVTDFITQWSEVQQIYKFAGVEREDTLQMKDGTRVHELLDLQMAAPDHAYNLEDVIALTVSPETGKYMELLGKLIALADPAYRSVREIRMRAFAPNGCLLRGIIDGVDVTSDGIVVTETKTTRKASLSSSQVRLAYHQALTYNWMFRQFLPTGSTESLAGMFQVKDSDMLQLSELYSQVLGDADEAIRYLSEVGMAPYVKLQFLKRGYDKYDEEMLEVEYDERVVNDVFKSRVDLFEGRREAIAGTISDADTQLILPDPSMS